MTLSRLRHDGTLTINASCATSPSGGPPMRTCGAWPRPCAGLLTRSSSPTPHGTITGWNPAAERLYGWTARGIVGAPRLCARPRRSPGGGPRAQGRRPRRPGDRGLRDPAASRGRCGRAGTARALGDPRRRRHAAGLLGQLSRHHGAQALRSRARRADRAPQEPGRPRPVTGARRIAGEDPRDRPPAHRAGPGAGARAAGHGRLVAGRVHHQRPARGAGGTRPLHRRALPRRRRALRRRRSPPGPV